MLPPHPLPANSKLLLIALLLLSLLAVSTAALANNQRPEPRQENQRQQPQRAALSAAEAADRVQRQIGGKVMGVQTRQSNGTTVYSVKILQSSGHMRTVNVNAQTGAIMN
ncbi:PepSY domain-containing protein [Cellvibrio polysaccharolyticus]|uniref:PepSY domain-containing protein n=1 Tax=Cellvibrio polysaccharolyticus TaxID=2082724 RepID=A0A928V0M0_9GAMM|nr:PepSY domain-containing protein [Cellvibrio polysaccharolyticus]MBE8716543.1 hypothetical protein [Cellvibrio polysaccharolyticus]